MNLIKKIANLITGFLIGFYGFALVIDTNTDVLIIKSIVFTVGVLIAFVIRIIDDYKTDGYL